MSHRVGTGRSIPAARLQALFRDDRNALRERVLWQMLYETAARAEETLSLNVEDLDTEFRRARVVSKGGAIEYVHWQTGTARLLKGRTSGRYSSPTGAPLPPAADVCPVTRRGRLSYPRAEHLFKTASARVDPHERGWTLHQLRHSALQHLAAAGAHRPRTAGRITPRPPGQHRGVRTPRRRNLRPHHRRTRPRRPPPRPLRTPPAPAAPT